MNPSIQSYEDLKKEVEAEVRKRRFDPSKQPGRLLNKIRTNVQGGDSEDPYEALLPLELIWCYWMEEGGLMQAIHTICRRFQNEAQPGSPLLHFDVSPLYRVADWLYGFVEDCKQGRVTSVQRRNCEYASQYGLKLVGPALGKSQPATSRAHFLESFHTLLYTTLNYYDRLDDRNINDDAFSVLTALKQLSQVLSYGSYNQFARLPLAARIDMTIVTRILDHQALAEFLGSHVMGGCEPWMARMDTMRKLMKWGPSSITEFYNLAECGEHLLLTVRYGPFTPTQTDSGLARTWAIDLREAIAQYVASYRAVTGVNLAAEVAAGRGVDATQPSIYLDAREREYRASAP